VLGLRCNSYTAAFCSSADCQPVLSHFHKQLRVLPPLLSGKLLLQAYTPATAGCVAMFTCILLQWPASSASILVLHSVGHVLLKDSMRPKTRQLHGC
jgi:hypothetical protein